MKFLIFLALCSCGSEFEVDDMTAYPPDDWELINGTWGTDADLIETVTGPITAASDAGLGFIVQFAAVNTTVAGMHVRIEGTTNYDGDHIVLLSSQTWFQVTIPWVSSQTGTWSTGVSGNAFTLFDATVPVADPYMILEADKFVEVEELMPVQVVGIVQADSVAVGSTVRVAVAWYDANKTIITPSDDIHNGVLPSAGVWHTLSGSANAPAGARFASPFVLKNNTAFHVAVDTLGIQVMPVGFKAYRGTTSVSLPDVTETVIPFQDETFDYGGVYSSPTFTAPVSGVYSLDTRGILFDAGGFNGAGTFASILVQLNGAAGYAIGDAQLVAGVTIQGLRGTDTMRLNIGDTIAISVYQNDGQTLQLLFGINTSIFTMFKVE